MAITASMRTFTHFPSMVSGAWKAFCKVTCADIGGAFGMVDGNVTPTYSFCKSPWCTHQSFSGIECIVRSQNISERLISQMIGQNREKRNWRIDKRPGWNKCKTKGRILGMSTLAWGGHPPTGSIQQAAASVSVNKESVTCHQIHPKSKKCTQE